MGLFEDLTLRSNGTDVDASWWNSIIYAMRTAFPDYTAIAGDVVGTTDTQDLSNKTFTDPLTLQEQGSTPSTPASGDKKLYAKTDGKLYTLDDAANEVEVGSGGGSGSKNYIDTDSAEFETSVGSWETDDGAGSAASYLTLSLEDTTPLAGEGSLKLVKSANDATSEFIKLTTLAIDLTDRGKILYGAFSYDATDAAYASSDMIIEVYDVTNAAVLYSGVAEDLEILNSKGSFNFVAYTETTTASIEIRLKINSTNASAYTLYFDEFKFGPAAQIQTIYRNSSTIDLTGSGDFTAGTLYAERVGNTVTLTIKDVTFPSDTVPDSGATVLPEWARPIIDFANNVYLTDTNGTYRVFAASTGYFGFRPHNNSGTALAGTGADFVTISYVVADVSAPTVNNNELSLQTIKVAGADNGGTALTANVTNITWTETSDSHSCWNGSQFTAPKTGEYTFEGNVYTSASLALTIYVHIDGTQSRAAGYDAAAGFVHAVNWSGTLQKGEILSFRSSGAATLLSSTVFHWMTIKSAPDYTVLGASKNRNKIQTKIMTSGNSVAQLDCANLVVGNWYEVTGNISVVLDGGSSDAYVGLETLHDGSVIDQQRIQIAESTDTVSDIVNLAVAFKFQASASTMTWSLTSSGAASYIAGNGTREETYIQIEERNDLVETSDF